MSRYTHSRTHVSAVLCIAGIIAAQDAFATGYEIFEHGARGVGTAGANVADTRDASVLILNPAGMLDLDRRNFVGAVSLSRPSAQFEARQATTFVPPPGGVPIAGTNGGDPGSLIPVPELFWAARVADRWALGAAFFGAFGLATSYDPDWFGRYHALKSKLLVGELNALVAYKINDAISVGGGPRLIYGMGELSNAIDLSAACLAQSVVVPPLAALCAATGFTTPGDPRTDGEAKFDADGWGVGWMLSVQMKPNDRTKVVLGYRSHVSLDLKGHATFAKPPNTPAPLAGAPQLSDGDAKVSVPLPESVRAAVMHAFDSSRRLYASANWTRWSRVQELRVSFQNGAPDAVTTLRWKDAWRIAIGAEADVRQWTFRAGLAYDESSVPDEFREPRVPMTDRLITGLGVSYRFSKAVSLDAGYLHIFFERPTIDRSTPQTGTLRGDYRDALVDMLTVQLATRF